jgi:hypothetical protein
VAAQIREALGVEVEERSGAYGEFTVLVDGEPVRSGNPVATAFALLPPATEVIAAVRNRLGDPP